ncbi:hypothetical protein L1987_07161 [Smallanthus sonchifolius]|uniref:Uncharacterized protein n=1 Tax=Smallanthus sonchifolius TaxID=185202 RepID=A0ACB9K069_9ASTR|nr:hypothetical protein L1987_07161 [Smallanthus sonchifolius]
MHTISVSGTFCGCYPLPSIITTDRVSADGSDTTGSGSADEFFEVEDIFSNVVDLQDSKVDRTDLLEDNISGFEVEPHSSQPHVSDDRNQNHHVEVDPSLQLVEDINIKDSVVKSVDLKPTIVEDVELKPTIVEDVELKPTIVKEVDMMSSIIEEVDMKSTIVKDVDLKPMKVKDDDLKPTIVGTGDVFEIKETNDVFENRV